MFQMMLFLHLAGLNLWFGATMGNVLILLLTKRQMISQETRIIVRNAIRIFGWLTHPSAIMVLVSGIWMIVQMNLGSIDKPMWLDYMEKGGGTIILVSIALTILLGGRISKRLLPTTNTHSEVAVSGGIYLISLSVILAAILSVVLVVCLRV